jgi:CHAD domain-containing protein
LELTGDLIAGLGVGLVTTWVPACSPHPATRPMTLEPELLDQSASVGARAVVLAMLAEAADAAGRAGDVSDDEALHDFRVALRRLRSTLRAWRPTLGASLRDRDLRRIRGAARATNAARDAEVLGGWVLEAREHLAEPHRKAADWLAARLERRRRHVLGRGVAGSVEEFLRRAPRLARRLAAEDPAVASEPFGLSLAALLRTQAEALGGALARASSPPDAARAHEARIEGKRLRYLLEPLHETPGLDASAAVKALKRMQDALGALNDARVAGVELAMTRVDAAAERVRGSADAGPGLRPGLLALERMAHERAGNLLAEVERNYLADGGASVLGPALAVAEALEERGRDRAPEQPARRYLLSGMPRETTFSEETEVEMGWLPGVHPRECFGAVRGSRGVEYFRRIQAGARTSGPTRPVGQDVFEAYWPLTEGRRIHKRCWTLPEAWRIEEYLDRPLVLAVGKGTPSDAPAWLEPWVVRDVTGERAYRDESMALRKVRRRPDADA